MGLVADSSGNNPRRAYFLESWFTPSLRRRKVTAPTQRWKHFTSKAVRVRPIVPLIKLFASAITIGSGGAAGREGPTAQISVGVGSMLADFLHLPDEERRISGPCGNGCRTRRDLPIALGMAIFSVEILYSGMAFETEALIYTVVASVVAYAVNGLFVGWSPIFLFPQTVHFTQPIALVGYAILGVVAGMVGAIEPPIFYGIRDLFRNLKIPNHVKPAIGGLLMGLLAVVVPETISTGYGWVQKAMTGDYIGWSLIFLALAKDCGDVSDHLFGRLGRCIRPQRVYRRDGWRVGRFCHGPIHPGRGF